MMESKISDKTYTKPNRTSRYSVWLVRFIHQLHAQRSYDVLEYVELIVRQIFIDYKIYVYDLHDKKGKLVADSICVVGKTPVRKRMGTLLNDYGNARRAIPMDEETNNLDEMNELLNIIDVQFYRSTKSFEKSEVNVGRLIATKSKAAEYTGKDLKMLDLTQDRFLWQNKMINFFYDEKEEKFREADDRLIYWICDKSGNVGKSKLVKWLCMNRPDEIVKVVFGSAQQLCTSLITIGPRLLYLIDIPRTPSEDEKVINMASSIEELKNGHIVSHMYGKYSSLLMEPPHIIILSNMECPKYLLTQDRWKIYSINKDTLDLEEYTDTNYRLA